MDWSKAKNILIIALVAVNVFLGVKFHESLVASERDELMAAQRIEEFLSGLGVSVDCEMPDYEKKLPVLFVSIKDGEGEEKTPSGMRIVVTGAGGQTAVSPVPGDNKGSVTGPFDAVLKLSCQFDAKELEGLSVTGAELVYLVDRAGLGEGGGQDTAVPAWEFTTSRGVYYIDAFAQ